MPPTKLNKKSSGDGIRRSSSLGALPTIREEEVVPTVLPNPPVVLFSKTPNVLVCVSCYVRDLATEKCKRGDLCGAGVEWIDLDMEMEGIFRGKLRVHSYGFFDEKMSSVEVISLFVEKGTRRRGVASAVIWTTVSSLCSLDVGVDCIFCPDFKDLNTCSKDVWGFCRRVLQRCSGTKWKPCFVQGCAGIRMSGV